MIGPRIDSMLPVHPAVRPLSDSAFRLYISAICWASLQHTAGHIPAAQLRYVSDVRRPRACADQLADAGLWKAVKDGWQIADYLDRRPPSAKKVRRERKAGVIPLQQRDPA